MRLANTQGLSRLGARSFLTGAAAALGVGCSLFGFSSLPAAAAGPTATVAGTTMSTNAIACPSATVCLAGASDDAADQAAIVKINGTTGAASISGTDNAAESPVSGIACPTATKCVAVAGVGDSAPVNGTTGTMGTNIYDSAHPVIYYSAACPTASSCLAGGTSVTGDPTFYTTLTPMTVGGAPGTTTFGAANSGEVDGLACVSTTRCYGAVAVGDGTGEVMVIDNGVVSKTFPTTFDGQAITCDGAASCLMVGYVGQKIYSAPLNPTTGKPGGKSVIKDMNSVSGATCATATTCFAVGYRRSSTNALTARVSDIASGVPAPATVLPGQSLAAIACPTTTTCWATGENTKGVGIVDSVPVP